MPRISEKLIERRLVEGVQWLGGSAYKWVCPGHSGVPDRLVFLPHGRIVLVELKADDGQLSPAQREMTGRLARYGFPVRVVYGLAGVKQLLEELRTWQERATVFVGQAADSLTRGLLPAPWEGGGA